MHPDRPDWGRGQVQSNIAGRVTVNFEEAGKVVIDATQVLLIPMSFESRLATHGSKDGTIDQSKLRSCLRRIGCQNVKPFLDTAPVAVRERRLMLDTTAQLTLRLAQDAADRAAAERLRYRVFVAEMGAAAQSADHRAGREWDRFDRHAQSLILVDPARPDGDHVVGLYRLMDRAAARAAGQFYSEDEFDIGPLLCGSGRVLELGRTCLDPAYRGGVALWRLWSGLARLVEDEAVELLFGAASFPGTDLGPLAQPLTLLGREHLAPPPLRARARSAVSLERLPGAPVDRRLGMLAMPALIKAYLRLGGTVGEGAFLDRGFNTTDVLMVLETEQVAPSRRALYAAPRL